MYISSCLALRTSECMFVNDPRRDLHDDEWMEIGDIRLEENLVAWQGAHCKGSTVRFCVKHHWTIYNVVLDGTNI